MFPRIALSTSKPYYITVTRKGTVRYRYRKLVVKENGKTQYIVRNVNNLQVYNRIEGLLKFTGSSKPRNRDFPGYGNVLQQIAIPDLQTYSLSYNCFAQIQDFYVLEMELRSTYRQSLNLV